MRHQKIILFAVFLFTLVFHGAVHLTVFSGEPPFPKYLDFARQQHVDGVRDPERLMDFSPLYQYVHSTALVVTGSPERFVLGLQFVLIACSAVLFFLVLRKFFGCAAACAGTAVFATSRSIVMYSGVYEPEVLLIFLLLGFLACVPRRSFFMAFAAGIFLGLCLLVRLNLFPIVMVTPFYYLANRGLKEHLLRRSVLFAVPVLAAVLFLSVRNHALVGSFSPVVMNPGYLFYEGNNPYAYGNSVVYPPMVDNVLAAFPREPDPAHVIYRHFARRIAGRQLTVGEVNSFWAGKALNYIADHPLRWAGRLCRKLYFVFHNERWHDIIPVIAKDRALKKSGIPAVPFGLISALAVVGLLASVGAWRERLIFFAVGAVQIGVMLLTYASDRQRISILALFVFFAVAGAAAVAGRNWRRGRKTAAVLAASALFPFFSVRGAAMKDLRHQQGRFEKWQENLYGAMYDRHCGRMREASDKNVRCLAMAPYIAESRLAGLYFGGQRYEERALALAKTFCAGTDDRSSLFDIIPLYVADGKIDKAESIACGLARQNRAFRRIYAQPSQPLYYCARAYELGGRRAEAVDALRKALKGNPGDPWALSHLAVLTGDAGSRAALARYYSELDAEFFMGKAYFDNGRWDEAARSFSFLTVKVPEYREGFVYLSAALGEKGDFRRAAEAYLKARHIRVEPVFCEDKIVRIFREWARREPLNPSAAFYAGAVLKDFGRYDEATAVFRKLLEEHPSMEGVRGHLEWVEHAKKCYGIE